MATDGRLGRLYADGEIVIHQGDTGDSLYVVEDGTLQVVAEHDGRETVLRVVGPGELIGEMAVFENRPRSATVRARGSARVLTLDKRNYLRRISEDPTLAFRIIEVMARRVRELSDEVVALQSTLQVRTPNDGR